MEKEAHYGVLFSLLNIHMKFYTYIHYRKDNGQPFYIGKGQELRAFDKHRSYNKHWTRISNKCGFDAKIITEWATEQEAFEHEKLLISCFRDLGFMLVNQCDGGEGPTGAVRSEELKQYLRSLHKGKKRRPLTEEEKSHLRNCHKGKKKGPMSQEHRQKVKDGIKRSKMVRLSSN